MNQEISVRLTEEVKSRAPGLFDKLQPALEVANQQLEWLCPAVMGVSRKGFVADLVAHVNRGTWLIVLANPKKVFTLHFLQPPAPLTRRQILDDCIERAMEYLGHIPTGEEIVHSIDLVVAQHGGQPHKKTPQVDEQVALQIFACCSLHIQIGAN